MDQGDVQRISSDVSHVIEELNGLLERLHDGDHAVVAYRSASTKFTDIGDVLMLNYPPTK